jgi:hypothetical protein
LLLLLWQLPPELLLLRCCAEQNESFVWQTTAAHKQTKQEAQKGQRVTSEMPAEQGHRAVLTMKHQTLNKVHSNRTLPHHTSCEQ